MDKQCKNYGTISHGGGQELRIALKEFKGKTYLDIRIYATDEAGEVIPTKKGVALREEELKKFFEILDLARADLLRTAAR